MNKLTFLLLFSVITNFIFAQDKKEDIQKLEIPETKVTKHKIILNGKEIAYTATTGYITLKEEYGKEKAHIFFIAYTKDGETDPQKRPLTFSFNGGPGSSSVWLHMGVLGPKRVKMTDEGYPLPPPYVIENNNSSWLDLTDMVFIDPVSTGYSRAANPKEASEFHGYNGDIESVGEFVRRYVTENKRWASPKYIIGESYGTTRASGLSDLLIDKYGMYLNGIILVSAITNFQTARFDKGNDLPNILFLPTYTASAYYHKKLSATHQQKKLEDLLNEVEKFASTEYTVALMKGDELDKTEREKIRKKLAEYTGLSEIYIERADLRINIHKFTKELLRENYEVIGRLDSRYKEIDMNANGEFGEKDPSYEPTIYGPYSTIINDYITRNLGFESKLTYEILTGRVWPWDYSNVKNQYLNVSENLRQAMVNNPDMKVWICNGYYDLATPYYATEYTINHMGLSSTLKKNIWMTYYPAGHMMYLHKPSLEQMKKEASEYYKK